jgi:predicted dehydrogenase
MGNRYHAKRVSVDWHDVCQDPELDAVILLNSGSHGAQALLALENGLHVFAEKPLCFTIREVDELEEMSRTQQRVLQVGYMKSHEAVIPQAKAEVERLGDLRLVRHAVFHPSEVAQQAHMNILRFSDADPASLRAANAANDQLAIEAIGTATPGLRWLYSELGLGSVVHYLSVFRSLIGRLPESIVRADAWPFDLERPPAGWGPTDQLPTLSVFASFGGECRLELVWAWLQHYPEYTELIEVLSPNGAVSLRLPPPYVHHRAAQLIVDRVDEAERPVSLSVSGAYDGAFGREIRDFYATVADGQTVVSGTAEAREDTLWCQALVKALAAGRDVRLDGEASRL